MNHHSITPLLHRFFLVLVLVLVLAPAARAVGTKAVSFDPDTGQIKLGDASTSLLEFWPKILRAPVQDEGGATYNIKAYGGIGNGTHDDTAAFNAAIAAVDAAGGTGEIYLPPGTWYFPSGILIQGSGKSLRGAGKRATIIKTDLSAAYALQLGVSGNFFCGKVSNLRIDRAAGTLPGGTIGIKAESYSYAVIEDVEIKRQDYAVKTANNCLGLYFDRIQIFDSVTHIWLKDAAETFIENSNFGVNGTESVAASVYILSDGSTNDVRIQSTQFINRAWPNTTVAFRLTNTGATPTGYFRFQDINVENLDKVFDSTATAAGLAAMRIDNSRFSVNGKWADFNSATSLTLSVMNSDVAFLTDTTLSHGDRCTFSYNTVSGGLTFNGGLWTVSDNIFTTSATYSGAFTLLSHTNNHYTYNGSSPITFTISGTGPILSAFNLVDSGAQPPNLFPNDIVITKNSITDARISIQNTNAAGISIFKAYNEDSGFSGEFGIRNSGRAAYGALLANDTYIYASKNITLMAERFDGVIKFATQGNSEHMRLADGLLVGDGSAIPDPGFGSIAARNPSSTGLSIFKVYNEDFSVSGEFGIRNSGRAAYGALLANDTYIYASKNLTFMTDRFDGIIKFAAIGNAERMRLGEGLSVGTTAAAAPGVINVATGFRVNSAALTGNVLRGDGTNFISAQLNATDLKVSTTTKLIGRSTAGAGNAEEITIGSGLSLSSGTLTATGSGGSVTSFSAGDLSPLFTTSVATATTTPALSFSLSTQAANKVFIGPTTGADAAPTFRILDPMDIPALSSAKITSGVFAEARGGTNQSTYTLGDLLYASAANTLSKLAGNTTSTKKYLSQTGTGTVSAAPVWAQVDFADLSGTIAIGQIANALITNAKLANSSVTIGSTSVSLGSTATTIAGLTLTSPTINGGALTALTTFALRDTSAAFDVTFIATSSTTLTVGRNLIFDVANASRTVKFTGNPTLDDWFNQSVKTTASTTFSSVTATGSNGLNLTHATSAYHVANWTNTGGQGGFSFQESGSQQAALQMNGSLFSDSSRRLWMEFVNTSSGGISFWTNTTQRLDINNNGTLRARAYGAGTLTTDASGNITASSDETMKSIEGTFDRGMADLRGLKPRKGHWTKESGLDTTEQYVWLTAQDLLPHIPEAVFLGQNGKYTVDHAPVYATIVNALNELDARLSKFEGPVAAPKSDPRDRKKLALDRQTALKQRQSARQSEDLSARRRAPAIPPPPSTPLNR